MPRERCALVNQLISIRRAEPSAVDSVGSIFETVLLIQGDPAYSLLLTRGRGSQPLLFFSEESQLIRGGEILSHQSCVGTNFDHIAT